VIYRGDEVYRYDENYSGDEFYRGDGIYAGDVVYRGDEVYKGYVVYKGDEVPEVQRWWDLHACLLGHMEGNVDQHAAYHGWGGGGAGRWWAHV
jgi:hypothetical protein